MKDFINNLSHFLSMFLWPQHRLRFHCTVTISLSLCNIIPFHFYDFDTMCVCVIRKLAPSFVDTHCEMYPTCKMHGCHWSGLGGLVWCFWIVSCIQQILNLLTAALVGGIPWRCYQIFNFVWHKPEESKSKVSPQLVSEFDQQNGSNGPNN